jgi:two-component system osmolarity sensor histidine kinase EnvZ
VTLFPRSLFWRLALLLLAVIVVAQLALLTLFRQDRADLVARQFGETKIAQIQALRAALAGSNPGERAGALARLGHEYGARIIPVSERPDIGRVPRAPFMQDLTENLERRLGDGTEVRVGRAPGESPGDHERGIDRGFTLWIKLVTPNGDYWAGFPVGARSPNELPVRLLAASAIIFLLLLASAWAFARLLNRPLKKLNEAVAELGKGETPRPLPETGPSEIASLSRGFNKMASNLQQMENDRRLLLAGVSHDLRTPLARLRLGVEMTADDEAARQGMIDDIEDMDKIISQFLDFARGEESVPSVPTDLNTLAEGVVERFRRRGDDIAFAPGTGLPQLWLRQTAIERLLSNLIDNAFRYGGRRTEVSTSFRDGWAEIDVADRGPGIPPEQVERLKLPFTRLDNARGGTLGSGLGLAIVERIARLHGGRFTLLPREGGGTLARVNLPLDRPFAAKSAAA